MTGATLRRLRAERNARGAAAVEFALIVPILVFLLFAIISYGYMLSFRQAVSQAASEAARASAVAPAGLPNACTSTVTDCRQKRAVAAINQGLGSYGVSCVGAVLKHGSDTAGSCTVSAPATCAGSTSSSQCVTVTLDYTYSDDPLLPKFPGLGVVLPDNLSYSTQVEVS